MATSTRRFKAKLGSEGAGSLFIELPFDPKDVFGKARASVKVTVNGDRLPLHGRFRTAGSISPSQVQPFERQAPPCGDVVSVVVEPDTEVRVVDPPAPLAAALRKNRRAQAAWEKLSYSHKKEHADHIAGAKRAATVDARVKKAIEILSRTPP